MAPDVGASCRQHVSAAQKRTIVVTSAMKYIVACMVMRSANASVGGGETTRTCAPSSPMAQRVVFTELYSGQGRLHVSSFIRSTWAPQPPRYTHAAQYTRSAILVKLGSVPSHDKCGVDEKRGSDWGAGEGGVWSWPRGGNTSLPLNRRLAILAGLPGVYDGMLSTNRLNRIPGCCLRPCPIRPAGLSAPYQEVDAPTDDVAAAFGFRFEDGGGEPDHLSGHAVGAQSAGVRVCKSFLRHSGISLRYIHTYTWMTEFTRDTRYKHVIHT